MVRRYLDTTDTKSTGNLHKHTRICWGLEIMATTDKTLSFGKAYEVLKRYKDGSITEAFEQVGKGKFTYSHR